MKKEIEITGKIENKKQNIIGIQLCIKNKPVSYFSINIERKKILSEMNNATKILLNIEDTFEDYMKLISDLGLEIPPTYKNHWTPTFGEDYFYVDCSGEICSDSIHKTGFHNADIKREEYYNMFPTRELAEKAVNLSKLERLILLWQYANDCLFTPTWKNNSQRKHFIKHDHINNTISCNFGITAQLDTVYFETEEQVEAFIDMYSEEIKKIMGVI